MSAEFLMVGFGGLGSLPRDREVDSDASLDLFVQVINIIRIPSSPGTYLGFLGVFFRS